jgi:predicted TPR repeat methyltransferase
MTDAILQQAITLQQSGKTEEAARLYREVLRINPAHFEAM